MKNKKMLVALVLIAIVGVVGATYAYFTSTATLNNEFKTGTYATSVTEEFTSPTNWKPGDVTTKKVNVINKGTVDVVARASYTESWTSADGTELDLTRDNKAVAQFTIGEDWVQDGDYYYYNSILSTDDVSTDFISSVTFNPDFKLEEGKDIKCTKTEEEGKTTIDCENLESGYAGATYRLNITIETIQADQAWDYTKVYTVGEEVTIAGETFNVVKDNGDTVTLLAAHNLGEDYRQSETYNAVAYGGETHLTEYSTYLQGETGDDSLVIDLMTREEILGLGCRSVDDDLDSCSSSPHASWLINGQDYWLKSTSGSYIWRISNTGTMCSILNNGEIFGIRPLVTISKDTLANL